MYHLKNLTDFDKPEATTLPEIIQRITSDTKIKAICKRVRDAKTKDDRRRAKLELPAFVLGEFSGKITNKDFIRSDYLLFDIDNLDKAKIPKLRETLKNIAICVFVSPSGEGLKFAIKLKTAVDSEGYRGNYEHYANYFTDFLGVELDMQTKDPSRKCYYAHDPDCLFNLKAPEYPVAKLSVIQKVDNVDEQHIDKGEISEVITYLKEYPLSFMEWTVCAMALQKVDGGEQLFMDLSKNKHHQDSDVVITNKFRNCGSAYNVTLGSLFWLAMSRGYKRNKKYLLKGGGKYPFDVEKDGSYYRDAKDNYIWVFGFHSIEYLYDIRELRTKDGRIDDELNMLDTVELMTCLRIDGKEIVIPTSSLVSGQTLKKEIARTMSLHFTHARSDAYFSMLSEYLHRTKSGAELKLVRGIGKLLPNLWNWGNYVLLDGNVYDYERIIWTGHNTGYMLECNSNIVVHPKKGDLKAKLKRLHYFFGDQLSIAIGWNIANLYFDKVMHNVGGFPILFIHGDSGKGKTKLGTMLLSMFGVANPESDQKFHACLADITHIAGGRLKNSIYCMPTFFDEYNIRHYHLLKSLYDGSGRITALKDQTNKVRKSDISGGTITAALNRPHEKEVLNRCIYFDAVKAVDDKKATDFNREFMIAGVHDELSALAINVAIKEMGSQYLENYKDAHKYLLEHCKKSDEAIGRITQNYAVAYAGYKLLVDTKVIEEWTNIDDWVGYCNDTVSAIKNADPVEAFLFICKKFAVEGAHQKYIRSQIIFNSDGEQRTRLTIYLKYILPEVQEYCRRRMIYPDILSMNDKDFQTKLRRSTYFCQAKTVQFFSDQYSSGSEGNGRAYVMDVPLDDDEAQGEENNDIIPF